MKLRLGTRASSLARTQSGLIVSQLSAIAAKRGEELDIDLQPVTTEGDKIKGPISGSDKSGVFVAALRVALISGECDLIVHSLKDMPVDQHADLEIAAIPARADARDALCSAGLVLAELPAGARVGTSAPRRAAQILAQRPDVHVEGLRGNIDTRLSKFENGDFDAIVLAMAGLDRLGQTDAIAEVMETEVMVPAPGQGALAVEIRADAPDELRSLVASLDDPDTRVATLAERTALGVLEAGCSSPVGAYATVADGMLSLHVRALSIDGALAINDYSSGPASEAVALGSDAGRSLLGRGAARLVSGA